MASRTFCGVVLLVEGAGQGRRRCTDRSRHTPWSQRASSRTTSRCGCRSRGRSAPMTPMSLHVLAGCDAAAAENALVVVADRMERGTIVAIHSGRSRLRSGLRRQRRTRSQSFWSSQLLLRTQERHFLSWFERTSSRLVLRACENLRGVGEYFHALVHRVHTGGRRASARSVDLDKADDGRRRSR